MKKENIESDNLNTSERIFAAASELMWMNGFKGTTTKMIAEKAGVNEVTVFRIFGNKKNILSEILKSIAEKCRRNNNFESEEFETLEEVINAFYKRIFDGINEVKAPLLLCIREALDESNDFSDVIYDLLITDSKTFGSALSKVHRNLMPERSLTDREYEIRAFIFLNTFHFVIFTREVIGSEFPYSQDDLFKTAKDNLLYGLGLEK